MNYLRYIKHHQEQDFAVYTPLAALPNACRTPVTYFANADKSSDNTLPQKKDILDLAEENKDKSLLMLGMDGAGKPTFL